MEKKSKLSRPNTFIIPGILYDDPEIQPLDRDVYAVVYWFHHMKDGECFAGNQTIADILKATSRGIQYALNKLEEKGHLYRTYKDKSKRHRKAIVPLIEFGAKRQSEPDFTPERTTVHSTERTTVRHNGINTMVKNKAIAANAAGLPKKGFDDPTPMTLIDFTSWMEKSPQRHMQIVGEYAKIKKVAFKTKGQWRAFTSRNVRAARQLSPYDDDQLDKAMSNINEAKSSYLKRWTLETLSKYLEENL